MSSSPENAPSTELPFRLPESADRRAGPVSGTRPLAVWAALAIVYVIWGSTYLGIRIAVETFPPYLSASVRFVAAALVLGALIAVRRGPSELRVRPRQVGAAALVGVLLLTGGNGLVVGAEHAGLPSGVAALLIATVPLLVVLLRLVTGDRPGWPTLAGVVVGFAGLAGLVASRGGGGTVHVAPALVVVVGAASWSVGSFFSGRLPLPGNPFVGSMYQMAAGGWSWPRSGSPPGRPCTTSRPARGSLWGTSRSPARSSRTPRTSGCCGTRRSRWCRPTRTSTRPWRYSSARCSCTSASRSRSWSAAR